jgi:hypothetical protein
MDDWTDALSLVQTITATPTKSNLSHNFPSSSSINSTLSNTRSPVVPPKNATTPIRQRRLSNTKPSSAKKAPAAFLDVIDRLDNTGLYGEEGFHRHDGPYTAASAGRNKGPRAPMAAFVAPGSSSSSGNRSRANLSPLALATLAAMESEGSLHSNVGGTSTKEQTDGKEKGSGEGPYIKTKRSGRRNSDSSITMGFPSNDTSGKGSALTEMYGLRDNEAWQDFGKTKYATDSNASSLESVGVKNRDRSRTNSIWDIEATLKAGVPVGSSSTELTSQAMRKATSAGSPSTAIDKPQRRKSIARFLSGSTRREGSTPEPTTPTRSPFTDDAATITEESPNRGTGAVRFHPTPPPTNRSKSSNSPALNVNGDLGGPLSASRSLGQEGQYESIKLVRRPSVMQRLFKSRANKA